MALRRLPAMSAFALLLEDKQTSGERVENDASDPQGDLGLVGRPNGINCRNNVLRALVLASTFWRLPWPVPYLGWILKS